ncbi:MAG: hypothetical protein PVF29_00430 [Desulfobacterales bacterium]|jgi:hypothetical protein
MSQQLGLFSKGDAATLDGRPADPWADPATEANAVDEMFVAESRYRGSREYLQALNFIARLTQYSAFNGFLLYTQNPALSHVATARTWARKFGRRLKLNARPLVILAPMGPVRFVYDLKDTEGDPVIAEQLIPYPATERLPAKVYENTIHNCALHGIEVREVVSDDRRNDTALRMTPSIRKKYRHLNLVKDAGYLIMLDPADTTKTKFARLTLELGHIFCGHLGIDKNAWWPERHHLSPTQEELEAESVAFLICQRKGLASTAKIFLRQYQLTDQHLPVFSLNAILQTVNYIETMGRSRWREPKKQGRY